MGSPASVARNRVTTHRVPKGGYVFHQGRLEPAASDPLRWDEIPLEGQEFLRFACSSTVEQAEDFVRGFGNTGLRPVLAQTSPQERDGTLLEPLVTLLAADLRAERAYVRGLNSEWPLPSQCFVEYPADLVREAHLLRSMVDAYRLGTDATLGGDEILLEAVRGRSWEGAPCLGPLQSAGLELRAVKAASAVELRAGSLAGASGLARSLPVPNRIEISRTGLLSFVAAVLQPILRLISPLATVRGTRLELAEASLPEQPSMIAVMYWQAARAFERRGVIAECALRQCPGPPSRPHLFLFRSGMRGHRVGDSWHWTATPPVIRKRREAFCSVLCSELAAKTRQRHKD